MHILAGFAAMVGVFFGASLFIGQSFSGFINIAAVFLVGLGPLAIMLISYDFGTLVDTARTLLRSIQHGGAADQTDLLRDLYRFGRTVREGRTADAGRMLSAESTHPLLHDLGGLALQRAEENVISDTVATVAYARGQRIKRAEEVLLSLGRVSPAMGMTGTVIGMIQLLKNMETFDKLGAGMAVAMISTLYGLVLQHIVYTPLARSVETYGRRLTVNLKLLERGLLAITTARPLHDLRLLAEQAGEESNGAVLEEAA